MATYGSPDVPVAVAQAVEVYTFAITGTLLVATGKSRIHAEQPFTIESVRAAVNTAPTGASVIVDVNKNGTTIYGTQGNRPAIAAGAFSGLGGAASAGTFAVGDYLTVDVDQVGSGVAGADLTVTIRLRRVAA
jgi:hypothetical protein